MGMFPEQGAFSEKSKTEIKFAPYGGSSGLSFKIKRKIKKKNNEKGM
jgi:hypothetical protein